MNVIENPTLMSEQTKRILKAAPVLAERGFTKSDAAREMGFRPSVFASAVRRHLPDLQWRDGRKDGRAGASKWFVRNAAPSKDISCGEKLRKRDTRIIQSGTTLAGHGMFCVYTVDRGQMWTLEDLLFGPARWKDCIAWRKEHTA